MHQNHAEVYHENINVQNSFSGTIDTNGDYSYVSERTQQEFWSSFYNEIKSWDQAIMKENDQKVYQAIMILFESKEDIEIFNKKAIYLYLREITNLNTKQIVNSLKKFRRKYDGFRTDWESGDI